MKLTETAIEFQAMIGRIAAVAGQSPEDVYALWDQYATDCRNADQSAVAFEFIQWNKDRLGGDREALQAAIDARHDQADGAQGAAPQTTDEAPSTPEPAPTPDKPRQWANDPANPAGKIQCKRFNDALGKLRWEASTRRELTGVIGGEEHDMCFTSILGGGGRADVAQVQREIGDRFGWTVSRSNVNEIVAAVEAALPELAKHRPVDDKRRTPEQDAARNRELAEFDAKREADEATKNTEADRIAGELRAKYPWARPASESLSEHARAAANVREELGRTFPGITFSVRSDHNSIRIGWELGPDERQVDEVTKKYKDGHWNGMEDIHEYDSSAYGKAVKKVLGRVTYFSNSRRYDTTENTRLLAPILCQLQGAPYDPHRQPWDQRLPDGESVGTAVSIILANTSFPPGAVIAGLEGNDEAEDVGSARDYHLRYRVTYTTPTASAVPAQPGNGTLGTVARNLEHDGVEVAFREKPSDDLRWRLKRAGFRITRRPPWKWYQKFSAAAWSKACELAGVSADCPAKAETTDPAGAYVEAQEAAYFDCQAEAIGA